MTTPAPTPPSAEAVAREVVDLIIRACYDPLSRRLMRDDAVALATAALTAHATAAVAAERERCAKLATNPYSDDVEARGFDEPLAVGAKIAAAIRGAPEESRHD